MEELEDKIVRVSFRRMFRRRPKITYKVGDTVKTTFGIVGKIVEVRKDDRYVLDADDTFKVYHESAILGYGKKQKQTTL